jgi:hypothetical protein
VNELEAGSRKAEGDSLTGMARRQRLEAGSWKEKKQTLGLLGSMRSVPRLIEPDQGQSTGKPKGLAAHPFLETWCKKCSDTGISSLET